MPYTDTLDDDMYAEYTNACFAMQSAINALKSGHQMHASISFHPQNMVQWRGLMAGVYVTCVATRHLLEGGTGMMKVHLTVKDSVDAAYNHVTVFDPLSARKV